MKTISRVLVLPLLISTFAIAASPALALGTCSADLQLAVPAHMHQGAMLSVNDQPALAWQANTHAGAKARQLLAKPNGFERYQRPVLVDKGICHQKSTAFNKATINM